MKEKLCYTISTRILHFKQPATTSRGVYHTRKSYYVHLSFKDDATIKGIGECATLPDLSCDTCNNYEQILNNACNELIHEGGINYEHLRPYPSILFGLETALAQIKANGSMALFDTPFARGEEGIPINGLVWMGRFDEMLSRIQQKIAQGFCCIKLKVGAIHFDKELELIKFIRSNFSSKQIQLRLDANGGFTADEALYKLEQLAQYDIHSIEQPIKQHQYTAMARLCRQSPIPIALDEELIGVHQAKDKINLLDTIQPQYVILKPSLHGGMHGTEEWINLAKQRNIYSWLTSALESNIGLNAIAHLAAKLYGPHITLPQGLGTGLLFTDNIPMPLQINKDKLWFTPIKVQSKI